MELDLKYFSLTIIKKFLIQIILILGILISKTLCCVTTPSAGQT